MKKILAIIFVICIIFGVAGFLYMKKKNKALPLNNNFATVSQNDSAITLDTNENSSATCGGNGVKTYDQCVDEVKNLDVTKSSIIYSQFLDPNKDTSQQSSIKDSSRRLMLYYYSCKILNDKDKNALDEAGKYLDPMQGTPNGFIENTKKQLSDILDGKLNTPYLTYSDNVALGDLLKICPDELPAMCKEASKTRGNNGNDEYCNNICTKIDSYKQDPIKAKSEILDPNAWKASTDPANKSYRPILSMAYRVGGKDLALQVCGESKMSDLQKTDCLNTVSGLDAASISCSDVATKLGEFVCKKQKNLGLCQ